jgi:mucin-2
MDTQNLDPENLHPGDKQRRPRWSGRTRRIVTTSAVSAVLLASGTAIGIALTGGASAAVSPGSTPGASTAASTSPGTTSPGTTSPGTKTSRCATIVNEALNSNHDRLARALHAFCTRPLVRLALVGGEHGTVTFGGKAGARTVAFERGTVKSDSGSTITVTAADGTTWTWDITSSTVIRQAGSKVAASAITTGERVFVGGTVVNGANDAQLIRIAKSSSS